MSKRPAPNKKEIAEMKVLSDLGHSPTAISKKMQKSHHTVLKYLRDQQIFQDSEIKRLITIIREREMDDLFLIGTKARKRLHELLDEGNTKAIETTAIMDRSFQQRRLLEGESTGNINVRSVIQRAERELDQLNEAIRMKENEEE